MLPQGAALHPRDPLPSAPTRCHSDTRAKRTRKNLLSAGSSVAWPASTKCVNPGWSIIVAFFAIDGDFDFASLPLNALDPRH
jgi:hypothetical protein